MKKIILVAVVIWAALSVSWAGAETLRVSVSGLKPEQGTIRLAVFDESTRNKFPSGEYLIGVDAAAAASPTVIEVPDIGPGEYAISVYQDLNDNGELDTNFFGIPKEPYGFSGRWKSGGAKYDEAVFNAADSDFVISVEMK